MAWRSVGDCALLVNGPRNDVHWLNRAGALVWRVLAAAAGSATLLSMRAQLTDGGPIAYGDLVAFLGDLERHQLLECVSESGETPRQMGPGFAPDTASARVRPRRRRITDMAEVALEIEPTPHVLVRPVGDGFVVRFANGELSVQTAEAAVIWDLVLKGPCSFVGVLDRLCDQFDLSYEEAERVGWPFLEMLLDRDALRGVIRQRASGADRTGEGGQADGKHRVGSLGRLDRMRLGDYRTAPPVLCSGPVVRDASGLVVHVAIVCQYGITGVTPGAGAYAKRCIASLRRLDVDLVILSGGGRDAGTAAREAESAAPFYADHLPGVALWLEQHATTTWENLKNSLEMLLARSIVPQRISVVGERARTEKLRASCWLAKRRFPAFRDVEFRAIGVARDRATWRDRRAIQAIAGSVLLVRESRAAGPLALSLPTVAPVGSAAGPVLREVSGPVDHVAIVCQYGINGITPGVGPYVQRCIGELRQRDVDLVIVAGGGRHVDAAIREAESVAGLYHTHVPQAAVWVENESGTTWENVQRSLEMLLARSIVPRRISVLGDRVRTEKLRVSCWLARRRFPALRNVEFRVVPVARQRATWRDRRSVQALASSVLLVREQLAPGHSALVTPPS